MQEYGDNYSWEAHETTTEDGYILTLFRLTGDNNGDRIDNQGSKGPLLLQHGFTSDAYKWFTTNTEENRQAMPIRLFHEGFDVWLGNNRGTDVSRAHVSLDADRDVEEYWNFSHHEYALFDMPAMTNKILTVRAEESAPCLKLSYIGHSLGTT